jgi:predicted ATPase
MDVAACSPHHQDSALFPFIDQLSRAAGFVGDDPPASKLEKLEALLALAAPPDEDVALLADLLSLPASERHKLPNLSPQRKKERTLAALIRQLEGLVPRQPVVMVFEDAHWIDPTSRELLDLTVERVRTQSVLLIVTFRPEFQPPWTGQPQVTMLALNRLDRHDRTVLVEQIAGGKALPADVIDQIAERTDGVPLFVEELTKSVLESGLLSEEADRYVLDRALPPFAVPTSLHDSLLARLDRLASVRLVAQIGAAIGREFSYELLRAVFDLSEDELQAALSRLIASELVFQRGMPPDAVYMFKHALVQDAAYSTLLRTRRQELHARIAAALEVGYDIAPEMLAHHFGEAGEAEKAASHWLEAGRRALRRSANIEAIAHLTKGLGALTGLPETGERGRSELKLQLALGPTLSATRGWSSPEAERAYRRAERLAQGLGADRERFDAVWGLWMIHNTGDAPEVAREITGELLKSPTGSMIRRCGWRRIMLLGPVRTHWATTLQRSTTCGKVSRFTTSRSTERMHSPTAATIPRCAAKQLVAVRYGRLGILIRPSAALTLPLASPRPWTIPRVWRTRCCSPPYAVSIAVTPPRSLTSPIV